MKGFCIITDENDIVISISMIPGVVRNIPERYNIYFPAKKDGIEGEKYTEGEQSWQSQEHIQIHHA